MLLNHTGIKDSTRVIGLWELIKHKKHMLWFKVPH